jgi:hypothetical protein
LDSLGATFQTTGKVVDCSCSGHPTPAHFSWKSCIIAEDPDRIIQVERKLAQSNFIKMQAVQAWSHGDNREERLWWEEHAISPSSGEPCSPTTSQATDEQRDGMILAKEHGNEWIGNHGGGGGD